MLIDTDDADIHATTFATKDEWDRFCATWNWPQRSYCPQPRNMYPGKFPCIMLYQENCINYRSNGNDEFWNTFIYPKTLPYVPVSKEVDEDEHGNSGFGASLATELSNEN